MNEDSVDPMTIFEDNQSTIAMTNNPQPHGKQNISILNPVTSEKCLQ